MKLSVICTDIWMIQTIFNTTKWLSILGGVFLKNAPIPTLLVVIATLISQISMMFASLLPLKVIMLLGSERVPKFFPSFLAVVDRNQLAIGLGLLALVFYCLNLLSKKVSSFSADRGAAIIIKKRQKLEMFAKQQVLATNSYSRFAESLASSIFFLLVLTLLLFIYPELLLVLAVYIGVCVISLLIIHKYKNLIEIKQTTLNALSQVGFFVAFSYIVYDFLFLSPPSFMIALISLIFSRLVLVRVANMTTNLNFLIENRSKINAIFFHNHKHAPTNKESTLIKTASTKEEWLPRLIEEATSESYDNYDIQWSEHFSDQTLSLIGESTNNAPKILIKLFDKKASAKASHEETLLSSFGKGLPCAPLLIAKKINNCHCHVYDISDYAVDNNDSSASEIWKQLDIRLLKNRPSDELIQRYLRSKEIFWERLDFQMLERMSLFDNSEDKTLSDSLCKSLPKITKILRNIPLVVAPGTQKSKSVFVKHDDISSPIITDWSSWKLSPAGVGMTSDLDYLEECILVASNERKELKNIPTKHFLVSVYSHALLESFKKNNHIEFFNLANKILELIR